MTILVTGATGTVGRHIVTHLLEGGHAVRALTRNPSQATFPAGVEVVAGDLAAPETLETALEGVTGLHLITFDNGAGGTPLQSGAVIAELAKAAGVQRVTVLMGGERSPLEEALDAAGLAWTALQPVEFMSNFIEWAEPIRTTGEVQEGFANRRSALVHESDIAAVAAVALTEEGHGGKSYPITGPEVLTPPEMLEVIGKALGRELRFVELSAEESQERWRAAGFDDETIEFFMWAHGNTPEIGYTVVPTVEQVTGRPARSFAQWVEEHIEAFR
jgi:uncharacterized protein YbjT (DUF2867 family)